MKKLMLLGFVFVLTQINAKPTEPIYQKIMDNITIMNNITKYAKNLHLITSEEQAPSYDGNELTFHMGDSNDCSDRSCTKMIVRLKKENIKSCLDSFKNQAIGTLPFVVDNIPAYLVIWTITEKLSQAKDSYYFYKDRVCIEIAYGYNGDKFEIVKKLIQKIY